MVPYPVIRGDYWANIGFWWDFEFWNRSVDREAGAAESSSPAPRPEASRRSTSASTRDRSRELRRRSYVAQAADEARFHIEGRHARTTQRGVYDRRSRAAVAGRLGLVRPVPRRLDASGHAAARIRVFAEPGQQTAAAAVERLRVTISSTVTKRSAGHVAPRTPARGGSQVDELGGEQQAVTVCVPRTRVRPT